MEINTRVFGEINIDDDKIISFEDGIIGYPEMKRFALLHNIEKKDGIRWLQSMDIPEFALPVMDPIVVEPHYNPEIEDELLKPLGTLAPDSMLVLVTVAVPSDLKKMTVNLKAPIVLNAECKKGCQVIVDGDEYPVKFPIYDILQSRKAETAAKKLGGE